MSDLKRKLEEQINKSKKESDAKPEFLEFGFGSAKAASSQPSHASSEIFSPKRRRSRRSSGKQRSDMSSVNSKGTGRRGSFPWIMQEVNEKPLTLEFEQSSPARNVNPPRPAKDGFEWVWFPEGYWAERVVAEVAPKKRPWFANRSSSSKIPLFSPKSVDQPESAHSPVSTMHTTSINRSGHLKSEGKQRSSSGDHGESHSKTPSIRGSLGEQEPQIVVHESESRPNVFLRGLQILSPSIQRSEIEEKDDTSISTSKSKKKWRVVRRSKHEKTQESETTTPIREVKLQSRTTMALEATTGYFDREQNRKRQTKLTATPPTSSPESRSSRRRFWLAPWHRKSSHETLISISTTLHSFLMGNTPAVSPASTTKLADEKRMKVVDLTDPNQDSYLPGEARRIKTPPLSATTPSKLQRGFFDTSSPDEAPFKPKNFTMTSPHTASGHDPGLRGIKKNRVSPPGGRELLESNVGISPSGVKSSGARSKISDHSHTRFSRAFELNVPEHLDTSPLCPANLFHPSGGTGICPYHGRRSKATAKSFASLDSVEILLRST